MTRLLDTTLFGNAVSVEASAPWGAYWLAFLRVITGWYFLHAGLDKYLAADPFSAAGWLVNGTAGAPAWLHAFLASAGNTPALLAVTNVMIPLGQVLIGLGLIVGALTRLAAFFGAFLMFFFYMGNADWSHGWVNGELFALLAFVTVVVFGAGRVWGLDERIEKASLVRNHPRLRYLLG